MSDCRKVQGTLVDCVQENPRDLDERNIVAPIYAYYDNGEEVRTRGNVAGNLRKYRKIGRKVTIVINDATKEAYCKEDMSDGIGVGIFFIVMGIGIAVLLVCHDFFGMFAG